MTAYTHQFSSVQWLSCVQLFAKPWTAGCEASLSITNAQSLLKLMSIESVIASNHLILCHLLLLLPSIFPSIRVFSNESVLRIRWPNNWSFSFSISPSKEYSGLISLRLTGLILQSKGLSTVFSNTTVQKCQFFGAQLSLWVQLSHPYMTTGKIIALTRQTFVHKVMSLLFNMLSRLVVAFLPKSKHLLISWLQSPSAYAPPYLHPWETRTSTFLINFSPRGCLHPGPTWSFTLIIIKHPLIVHLAEPCWS